MGTTRQSNGVRPVAAALSPIAAIAERIDKLARDAGPKWGAACLMLAGFGFIVLAVSHRALDHVAWALFSFGGAAGIYGLGSRQKRNTDMIATGTAELKDLVTPPGVPPPPSADPAIDRAQQKIEAGLPPTSEKK